ncbi:MAG: hypothetical protein D6722_25790 [Bacteroidetes bacterium]|nr:MAG: hypothetical protein D6722_25790 [Bacteroidota bacterium]
MNTKIKALLLIGLTLLIGFGAGFLANGWYVRQRFEKARTMARNPDDFMARLERDLNLDAETLEAIRPIFRTHHERMRDLSDGFRQDVREEMDQLRRELAPHLTQDQIELLNRRILMRRGGGPGPHPGPRPPEGRPPHGPPPPSQP